MLLQFTSSLRRISLRNSIIGSKNADCFIFDEHATGSIFSLQWNKRSSPPVEQPQLTDDDRHLCDLFSKLDSYSSSSYKKAILGYIAGFVVCKILKDTSFPICASALSVDANKYDHQYSKFSGLSYLSLISVKNRGDLFLPSNDVLDIVHT